MNLIINDNKKNTLLPKIMRAAVNLFIKKGVNATTTKDIAKKAKVAEGSLYRHFKSKDELAWHIFSANLNEFSQNLIKAVENKKNAKDKIKIFISQSLASFEKDRVLFTYMLISEHRELNKFPKNFIHPGHVALKIIEEGQKKGELKKINIYVAGSIFVGSLIRLCAVRMYGNIKDDIRNYEEDIFSSIWNALKNE
ncbi:MAG: helix-turn-helix domain-containing protein [bacterium]